jgi:hypothetical protein
MARRPSSHFADRLAALLPPEEARPAPGNNVAEPTAAPMATDLLTNLPTLLSAAELATWLGVSTETVRRRIRARRQPTIEVLGIQRVTAASAVEQVRERVVARLPARYRPKSSPCAQPHPGTTPASPIIPDDE